jgi:hypothetical protein
MVKIYDIMNITCQNLHHMPYQPSTYIYPRGDIGFLGWYSMWYRFWHVIFSIYHIKGEAWISHSNIYIQVYHIKDEAWISHSNICIYHIKGKAWDEMRNQFWVKYSRMICLLRIWSCDVITKPHYKTAILCKYHASWMLIDIIVGKDERENVQIIHKY